VALPIGHDLVALHKGHVLANGVRDLLARVQDLEIFQSVQQISGYVGAPFGDGPRSPTISSPAPM
jgi:hypothetical protein